MDFRFDQDERDIIEQAERTLARDLAPRGLLEGDRAEGWRRVAEDGWLLAGLDADAGGAGVSLAVLAGIARGAGRVLAGNGFVDNAVLLPELVAAAGGDPAAASAAPGFLLADGRAASPAPAPAGEPVPWCFGAERGLAAYALRDGRLGRYGSADWVLEPLAGLGLGTGTVTLREGAAPEVEVEVGELSAATTRRASVVHSAALVGLGDRALEDTVEYVGQREQFGGPIGRFQALKHALADVSVELEIAWNAVLYAALRPDPIAVAGARLQATDAAGAAARAMVQFFGGIAMTWEHHAHLYAKTALADVHRFGPAADHARLLASDLLEEDD